MARAAPADAALDAATEAAIGWLVTLNSGQASAQEHDGFARWLDADPRHRAAWEQLHAPLQQMLAPLRGDAAPAMPGAGRTMGEALARAEARARRRRALLRGALGLGGVAAGAALLAHAAPQPPGVQAPAFIVRTAHGQVRALGTRFIVRQHADDSLVGMLEHSVEITTASGQRQTLHEGRSARWSPTAITPDPIAPGTAAAWRHGLFEAHDQPLGDVVQALRAYRRGFIRIAPRAAALRVYGSYALDDTDRALAALAETLPIEVRVYQRGWLVMIE
ncbi:MAG: DUF4880 domain-containing protein [Comamonadaceae bacterium]|nr:DUF4880 domain-containing protein [Comamonadaceae bacterium]